MTANFCPSCGAEVIENAKYCMECGADIEAVVGGSKPTETRSSHTTAEGAPLPPLVREAIGYGVGALLLLSGLGGLLLSPVGGLILLATGLFAMPVVRDEVSSRTGMTFSSYVVIGVVLAGIIVGGTALPSDTPSETADTQPNDQGVGAAPTATQTATPAPTESELVHDVGESFTVGSGDKAIRYTVTDVSTREFVGSGVLAEEADGIFVVVRIEMENVGDETIDITSDIFRLTDDQNREYETDSDAILAIEDNVLFEQLDPGVTKEASLVFDVPPDQSGRRLEIRPAGIFSAAEDHFVELE